MQVTINTNETNSMAAINLKIALQKIVTNFNKENILKIAELSEIKNPNEKIKNLFNNPLFKMAL